MTGSVHLDGHIDALLEGLRDTPWNDVERAIEHVKPCLVGLAAERGLLVRLLERVGADSALRGMAEEFDYISQIVLVDRLELGYRLRLHIYGAVQHDWPHNHRWPLVNMLVQGRLIQSIYDTSINLSGDLDYSNLQPIVVADRTPGDIYALHPDVIDVVVGQPGSVALLVRGPAMREHFTIFDRQSNRSWDRRGSADETDNDKAAKAMSDRRFEEIVQQIVRRDQQISLQA